MYFRYTDAYFFRKSLLRIPLAMVKIGIAKKAFLLTWFKNKHKLMSADLFTYSD